MSVPKHPLDVALLGFGTVGRAVARQLCLDRHPSLRLRAVCTRRSSEARASAPWMAPDVVWTEHAGEAVAAGAQVVIELIGGLEPARSWIAAALEAGCSVVTANKQVMAEHGADLVALARSRGVSLGFEAAVGGAIPVVRGVQCGLAADCLVRVSGVLNGTTNFVLTRMERDGISLADAVADAQGRGFAEADPSADLDGLDARAKLAILAAIGLGTLVKPSSVSAESIRGIEPQDFAHASSLGRVIRQVAWAERSAIPGEPCAVAARVAPVLVDRRSWLAGADGPRNVVVAHGLSGGDTVFAGEGAGGEATAVAVLSDALAIAHAVQVPRPWPAPCPGASVSADITARHYVRVSAASARPAGWQADVFTRAGLRVQAVLDDGRAPGRGWAAVLESASTAGVAAALAACLAEARGQVAGVRLPLVDLG